MTLKHLPPKRLGEFGEVCFLLKALSLDFICDKTYGDSDPYDFIVARRPRLPTKSKRPAAVALLGLVRRHRFHRIQVRCCSRLCAHDNYYMVNVNHPGQNYTRRTVDFFAVYILPVDAWYIVPIEELVGRSTIHFSPHIPNTRALTEQYREAWHLLQ